MLFKKKRKKTGVVTGAYAINPVNQEKIPVWISDYVLMSYGTGAIMAVPAHDERDFELATKFGLDIIEVISHPESQKDKNGKLLQVYTGEGTMVNSGKYTGMESTEGKKKITTDLEKKGLGRFLLVFSSLYQPGLRKWSI